MAEGGWEGARLAWASWLSAALAASSSSVGGRCRLSSRAPGVGAPTLPTKPFVRTLSVGGVSGVCLHPFLGSPLARRSWGDSPQSCVLMEQICSTLESR